ncbi:MAG: CRISPR system precrRNA processing endoribonuclease RAMP protein Cas6 [Comamonadaceae bacterium]|nr:CRISPR system precrRNA processing endoribonuclease RAMP protein Cas6 [Comamonadaceae bacterium]
MQPLPIARYALTARVQQPLSLPDYAGSLLRGQFGAALRHVACMTRQPTCPGCPLVQTCPYTRIFEAPPPPKGSHALQDFSQIPNPYIIEPPTPGARVLDADDDLVFHLVLVGHAIDQLALIVFALQRALQHGLTKARVPADLMQVDWVDATGQAHLIWHIDRPVLQAHTASVGPAPTNNGTQIAITSEAASAGGTRAAGQNDAQITLHIQTPLRLQSQGKPLGVGQLTPRVLIAAIARRTALLMEFHAGLHGWGDAAKHISHLSDNLGDTQDLRWFDWTRYSSRQQQEMTLGGVLGRWALHGNADTLAQIYPWLWLGQWLHVGKNASMGLGGYTLGTVCARSQSANSSSVMSPAATASMVSVASDCEH